MYEKAQIQKTVWGEGPRRWIGEGIRIPELHNLRNYLELQ
jgi:hypothetical protein